MGFCLAYKSHSVLFASFSCHINVESVSTNQRSPHNTQIHVIPRTLSSVQQQFQAKHSNVRP